MAKSTTPAPATPAPTAARTAPSSDEDGEPEATGGEAGGGGGDGGGDRDGGGGATTSGTVIEDRTETGCAAVTVTPMAEEIPAGVSAVSELAAVVMLAVAAVAPGRASGMVSSASTAMLLEVMRSSR